jgi:D-3-phosphoglycerate dehydrogenase
MKILVADKLAQEGLDYLKATGMAFDVKVGLKEAELAAEVPSYDALIVRSGAKVTAKVLENPGLLKVIARAGVGVDNIDLPVSTAKGILVLNTASASTLSTAEHAWALLMSLARKIPGADAHVRSGPAKWEKTKFEGTQLAGKTIGVVGLGRIGQTVAARALAFEMNVLGFDPFVQTPTVMDGKVKVFQDFDEFLAQLDIITFHVPGGAATKHLINKDRLDKVVKKNLLIVNDSRGEVIDEFAVAQALKEGKIAGAAIDVYMKEPPQQDHPLFACPNTVLTPHLGASTEEAQTAVSVQACEAIVAYLQTGEIRGAVNAGGIKLDLPPDEAPFADLAKRIGAMLSPFSGAGIKNVTIRVSGVRTHKNGDTLKRLAAVELLRPHLTDPVNVINVEQVAKERGIEIVKINEQAPPQGLVGDILGIRVECQDGTTHRILGTAYADGLPRVLRIDNYSMDMIPEGHMVLIKNKDMPGVIGMVGSTFGEAKVNIADMVISREFNPDGSATARMVIKTDSMPTEALITELKNNPVIIEVTAVKLPDRPHK